MAEAHKGARYKALVNWIESGAQNLGSKRLNQLVLPGSHDAGAYWVILVYMFFIRHLGFGLPYALVPYKDSF